MPASARPPERPSDTSDTSDRVAATGIPGLDDVLDGGLTRHRLYVLEGMPGTGKTTVALQFVLEGVRRGEPVLYVTLSESAEELTDVAASHGWVLDGVSVREIAPPEANLRPSEHYTVFHPAEVELGATTDAILRDVEKIRPARVVIDSLSELRLLAGSPLRYRRQILAMKQYFAGRQSTVLLLDDLTAVERDLQVQSIANGVILLEQLHPEYGTERRRLRVVKHRGRVYRGGHHDYAILRGGLAVYPRLVAAEHRQEPWSGKLSSGQAAMDRLLGGGIERATSTLIVGAAGTGKSTLAASFVCAAAERGESAAMFLFDEGIATLRARTGSLGMRLPEHVDAGRVVLQRVDPAELSPGELTDAIRRLVDGGARVIVIDSLNGYMNAMPEERFLLIQLHELLAFLAQKGVTTFMVGAHAGLISGAVQAPVDASYLADNVILMRYYELRGEVRQAISVLKKRSGQHERAIREVAMGPTGLSVGEPLRGFRGVMTGVPVASDDPSPPPGSGESAP